MALFSDFPIRFVDASQYQDDPTTPYKPTLDKTKAAGFMGFIVRVGWGLVLDRMFRWFWALAKVLFVRQPYWYLDYYSHKGTGTTDYEWGAEQAYTAWEALKTDPGDIPLAIDCEASSYGGAFTIYNKANFNQILKGFIDTWMKLSGQKPEIYTSPSLLWLFEDWVKDFDLWLAWYNKSLTFAQVQDKVRSFKWRGKIQKWQYASNGDINNDGIADGLALGFESSGLDLSVYTGDDWVGYSGQTADIPTPEPLDELFQIICLVPSLTTRDAPSVAGNDLNHDLTKDEIIGVYAIDPATGWYRIDPLIQRWCSGSATYVTKYVPPKQSFVDVPPTHWAYKWIEEFYARGFTSGKYSDAEGLHYLPGSPVTRAEIAVFILSALGWKPA